MSVYSNLLKPRPSTSVHTHTLGIVAGVTLAFLASISVAGVPEVAFHQENSIAMQKMMADMHVLPSGDIDRDFANMMIAHHQGAIDMAMAELKYGKNAQLKRLAQEIIVEQQQEIEVMRLALGRLGTAPSRSSPLTSPRTSTNASHHHH